ncbi:hypothetical protein [Bdellovibrio bacteriovorus]|uniref:hypothetical protein n=1 Tax=Bdellovibrio bacteriovorus TaxID=959 RepID=UPI0035A71504
MRKSLQGMLGIMLVVFIVSCATKPLISEFSKKDGSDVETAARSGDVRKLRELLSSKDIISDADRYNIIFNAVANDCHPEVVRLAIEKNSSVFDSNLPKKKDDTFADRLTKVGQEVGIGKQEVGWDIGLPERPGAKLINVTAKHFCPNALMMISEKTQAEDFAIGIYKRSTMLDTRVKGATIESFLEVFEKKAYRDSESQESTENILSTLKFISDRLKNDCQKYGSESCTAQKALKETVARLQGYAKEREYAESSDGILDQACEAYGNIEYYLGLIKEENEKGKISGYVNKFSLKHWGDRVYSYKKEFVGLNNQYKAKSKKDINPQKQCGD